MAPKKPNEIRKKIKVIQINMQNAIHVVSKINHYITKNDIDVALLQDPYNRGGSFILPPGYGVISGQSGDDTAKAAIIFKKRH